MKSYIDTVDDIKVTAITGLTNSNQLRLAQNKFEVYLSQPLQIGFAFIQSFSSKYFS